MDNSKLEAATKLKTQISTVDDCIAKWIRVNNELAKQIESNHPSELFQDFGIVVSFSHDAEKMFLPEFVRLCVQSLSERKLKLEAEFAAL